MGSPIPEKDVTYVQITGGGNVASLDSGQTFACMGSQNAEGVYLKENNYPLLMDLSNPEIHQKVIGASKFHLHMIHVTNKYLEEHPESVQAFLNAIVKAIGWINTHSPEEIYESVEIYFPSDEKETGVKIVEMNLEILSSDCYISQEGHDAVVDWSINLVQYIKNYIPIEDIYDSSYLEKAWQNVSK